MSDNKTIGCTNDDCWLRSLLFLSSVGLAQLGDPFPVWAVLLLGKALQMILAMTECWVAEVPKEEELRTRDTKECK